MTPKTVSKPSQKQKRISCTGKGGEADSTPQIPGENTGSAPILRVGDRVQVICPPGWSELAYANTGQLGTVQLIGSGQKLKGKIAIELDEPPARGKRCDVWISVERLMTLPLEPEGWNESEEGQNFWERFELLRPYLSKANLQTGYFDRSLDYPRPFEWLEVLEGKRQLTLPLDPVCQSLQSAALATGFPICELTIVTTDPTPEEQIAAIKREGPIAPDGIWIETGKVSGKAFRQAWYRSRSPCFAPARKGDLPKKTQYLGAVGGDRHKEAVKAIERRNKIKKLKKIAQQKAGTDDS